VQHFVDAKGRYGDDGRGGKRVARMRGGTKVDEAQLTFFSGSLNDEINAGGVEKGR
jgi:hypothetical protein